jgi:very-short-patch-repair endonuclease
MHIDIQRDHARTLRKSMPMAERRIWSALRGRRLHGFKFNRQVEIGPYIVDFLCSEKRLIVEVDGVGHSDAADAARDARRTAYLQSRGYAVFRCWNEDVYKNLDGVLEALLNRLNDRESRFQSKSR